jgi:colanic acid/amylovoran biosynthesis glycosyltransferase
VPKLTVGHFLRVYLPYTETFIYTLLRHHRDARPVVFAGWTSNLDRFPIEPLEETYTTRLPLARRVSARVLANLNGYGTGHHYRLAKKLRSHGCSLVHAHHGGSGWTSLPTCERLGLPLITTFYGRDVDEARRDPEWAPRYEHLFRAGRLFVVEGSAMADHLARVGAPRDRIRIVRIGLELERFSFEPRDRARPFVFIQAARFMEKKGVDVSIKAFARARGELGEAELWLVGDGSLRPDLEELSRELGVADGVRFLGNVSHAELRDIMARAHAGVHPSRTAQDGDTEGGAPTTILEMQAMGLPVVSTRHADIPEVVPAPDELVQPDDVEGVAAAMVELVALDEQAWRERARAGRALMEAQHDIAVTSAEVESLYRELAGR